MNRGVEIDSRGRRRRALGDPAAGDVRHRGAHGGDEHPRGPAEHDDRDRATAAWSIPRSGVDRAGTRLHRRRPRSPASARRPPDWRADRVIDARGPGRGARASSTSPRGCASPGFEYKATLESEMEAAIAGGVTSLACPPDTDPPLDEPGLVEMLKHRARSLNQRARLSDRRADGRARRRRRSPRWASSPKPGCVAFSQADAPLADTQVLLRAMQYAPTFGYAVWLRPQDAYLGAQRRRARRRGRDAPRPAGIPVDRRDDRARDHPRAGARDAACACTSAGCRRAEGVALMRAAKRDGLARHVRRRDPPPAPVRRRHRLVRRAVRIWCRRCAARATARRCARASPTARSTRSAPTTRRSTTTPSSCRSARPSPARRASSCCCR